MRLRAVYIPEKIYLDMKIFADSLGQSVSEVVEYLIVEGLLAVKHRADAEREQFTIGEENGNASESAE